MKKIFLKLFIVITFFSCEEMSTVIDLDLPQHESLLVVYTTPISENETKIYVASSLDPLSNDDFEYLNNALVTIKNSDQIDTATFFNVDTLDPYYIGSPLKQGYSYELEVAHDNFLKASSNLIVPNRVPVVEFYIDSIYEDAIPLSFTIEDPLENNFYRLKFEVKKGNKWKRVSFESYDPTFDGGGFIDDSYGGRSVYFTDQLFNNSQKQFNIELDVNYQIDSIKLNLFTISESYYNYHISRKLQNRNENNPLNDLLGAEPVVVYNNINNGFGVLGIRVKNDSIIPVIY